MNAHAHPSPFEPKRDIIAPRHESLRKEFDGALGPQPREYGEARLWIVARDAHWVFSYWEFDPNEHPEAAAADGQARFFIRVMREDSTIELTQEIQPDAGDLFIRVTQPDAEYSAELGFYAPGGAWCFITHSGTTRTPAETGHELVSPAADNGKGIRNLRAILLDESRPGETPDALASRVREKVGKGKEWTAQQEGLLSRLLAADSSRKAAQKRKH